MRLHPSHEDYWLTNLTLLVAAVMVSFWWEWEHGTFSTFGMGVLVVVLYAASMVMAGHGLVHIVSWKKEG